MSQAATKYEESRSRHYSTYLSKYYRLPVTQVSLSVVLSLFLIAVFLAFALRPTLLTIFNLRSTIAQSEQTLTTLDAKIAALQRAQAAMQALTPSVPYINASIPVDGAEYNPLTASIEVLAAQDGVLIDNESVGPTLLFSQGISPFTPARTESVLPLSFTIQVSGKYSATMTFFRHLLTLDRIIGLKSVSLSQQNAVRNGAGGLSLNVAGSVYLLANQTQLTSVLVTVPQPGGS